MAPSICATRYAGTSDHGNWPMLARPRVTAGCRWAPLMSPTAYTPMATARAHPVVMTIQPAFWPLDRASRTLATTPSPSRMRIMVPMSSPIKGLMIRPSLEWRRLSARPGRCGGAAAAGPGHPAAVHLPRPHPHACVLRRQKALHETTASFRTGPFSRAPAQNWIVAWPQRPAHAAGVRYRAIPPPARSFLPAAHRPGSTPQGRAAGRHGAGACRQGPPHVVPVADEAAGNHRAPVDPADLGEDPRRQHRRQHLHGVGGGALDDFQGGGQGGAVQGEDPEHRLDAAVLAEAGHGAAGADEPVGARVAGQEGHPAAVGAEARHQVVVDEHGLARRA